MCQPVQVRRSHVCDMDKSIEVGPKWLPILQARTIAAGANCDTGGNRLCLQHSRDFKIGTGIVSGPVDRRLRVKCCHVEHVDNGSKMCWISKTQRVANGYPFGSQICGSCKSKSTREKENTQPVAKQRMSRDEVRAKALRDHPKIDPNAPATGGEREQLRALIHKFSDPEIRCVDDNGRIRVYGVNGGPPVVFEVVVETRKSSVKCSAETVRNRTKANKKRRLSGCVAPGASKNEVINITYLKPLPPVD
jgi:hypothetical protein